MPLLSISLITLFAAGADASAVLVNVTVEPAMLTKPVTKY